MTALSLTIILSALEDAFFTWSFNNFPTVILTGGLMWFTWWIRGHFSDYRSRFIKIEADFEQATDTSGELIEMCRKLDVKSEKLDGKCGKLDERCEKLDETCKRLDASQKSFNKRLKSFGRRLTNVEVKLDGLIDALTETGKITPDSLQGRSPLELTEIGEKIIIDTGGKHYIDTHLAFLLRKLERRTFKSPLDVQRYSFILLIERMKDDGLIPVKNYIFVNPMYRVSDTRNIQLTLSN